MQLSIEFEPMKKGGLFVGIPMYGGMCCGTTAKSLLNLSAMCAQRGIPLRTYFLFNESLIQRARNYVVDEFLRSDCDTMIFIDADISFDAIDIFAMWHLQLNNPEYDILCSPYPKKCIAYEKVAKAVEMGFAENNPNNLENFVGDYVFSPVKSGKVKLSEPFEVLESGTGFMMIRRETFTKWKEKFPEYEYTPDHARTDNFDGSRKIHAFFHCEIDPDTNQYLSEDYFFCRWARKAGLKIWICPWVSLHHTGTYTFRGSLSHIAQIGASTSVDKDKIKKKDKK